MITKTVTTDVRQEVITTTYRVLGLPVFVKKVDYTIAMRGLA